MSVRITEAGMKLLRRLSLVLAVSMLASCANPPMAPKAPSFVGRWVNRDGTLLVLHHNGTFEAQINESSTSDIWGNYSIIGNRIQFASRGGHLSPRCSHAVGVYRFYLKDDTLLFKELRDSCEERAHQLSEIWHRP